MITRLLFLVISIFSLLSCNTISDKEPLANTDITTRQKQKVKINSKYFTISFNRIFPFEVKQKSVVNDFNNVFDFSSNYIDQPNFWFLNKERNVVFNYDEDFKLINSFKKPGEGPEDITQAYTLNVNDDDFTVYDFPVNSFKTFSKKDGNLISSNKLDAIYYSNIVTTPQTALLCIPQSSNGTMDFVKFDFKENKASVITSVNEILAIKKEVYTGIVYDGILRKGINQSVYYAFKTGILFWFDNDNNFIKYTSTIDGIPPPKGMEKELANGYTISATQPSFQFNLAGCFDGNENFYLLNCVTDKLDKDKYRVIDVYSIKGENNGYLYSISIPEFEGQNAQNIKIIKNKTLIVYYDDQTIVNYEIIKTN